MTPHEQAVADEIAKYTKDPLGFAGAAYDWGFGPLEKYAGLRAWQSDVLSEVRDHLQGSNRFDPLRIAIASGHGIGKTALIAIVSDWAMSTCDDCRVMITANTEDQLVTKTWPEVTKWFNLSLNRDWWDITATRVVSRQKGHENAWRMDRVTWSENNTEAFQGLHNLGKRIVVIFDEASSIPDKIWEVTEGALTDESTEIIWLAFGNPTQNTGRFRECFGRFSHRWVRRNVDARRVPGTNKALIEKWIADWGEDSDFVRVRVKGEFPRAGSSQFIAQDVVAAARRRTIEGTGWKVLAVDVARFGSNQTVRLLRHGGRAWVLGRMRGASIAETAARVESDIISESPRCCIVDGDGIGGGVVDILRSRLPKPHQPRREWPDTPLAKWFASNPWFTLQEFHGAATPADPFMYFNKRAEVWGLMRSWLKEAQIPDEAEFEADLTGPEYYHSNKNQIQLERKDEMEARGLASPDNGDALAMSFAAFPAAETKDEKLVREQAAIKDPMELHFAKLRETERRAKSKQPGNYWE